MRLWQSWFWILFRRSFIGTECVQWRSGLSHLKVHSFAAVSPYCKNTHFTASPKSLNRSHTRQHFSFTQHCTEFTPSYFGDNGLHTFWGSAKSLNQNHIRQHFSFTQHCTEFTPSYFGDNGLHTFQENGHTGWCISFFLECNNEHITVYKEYTQKSLTLIIKVCRTSSMIYFHMEQQLHSFLWVGMQLLLHTII